MGISAVISTPIPERELSHHVANITDRNRVNSGEGLIEEHEFWLCGEGAGDFHAATLSARECNSRRMPDMGDRELIKQLTQRTLASGFVGLDELEYSANIVFDRKSPEDRAFLGQIANASLARWYIGRWVMSAPSRLIVPWSAAISPVIM